MKNMNRKMFGLYIYKILILRRESHLVKDGLTVLIQKLSDINLCLIGQPFKDQSMLIVRCQVEHQQSYFDVQDCESLHRVRSI